MAKRSTVLANKRAISQLKMAMHGPLQSNMVVGVDVVSPSTLQPVLFDLTDFTRSDLATTPARTGGKIWTLNSTGQPVEATRWQLPPLAGTNSFTLGFQGDQVNGGSYMALSNYVTIEAEATAASGISNAYLRVQVFSYKPQRTYDQTSNTSMPDALTQMKHLAEFASGCFLPRKFFKIYSDQTIVFNSRSAAGQLSPSGTLNKKYIRVKMPHRKLVKQQITAPEVQSPNVQTPIPEPGQGFFGMSQRAKTEPIYCLISCDDRDQNLPNIQCTLRSLRTWRDPTGGMY